MRHDVSVTGGVPRVPICIGNRLHIWYAADAYISPHGGRRGRDVWTSCGTFRLRERSEGRYMAVLCPRCGELAYANGVCAQCGFSLSAPPWEGTQEMPGDQGATSDPGLQNFPWAQISVDTIGHASAEVAAPQRQLRIRKLAQDPPTPHEGQQWEFAVDGKQISIGRAPSCDLSLES